MSTEAWIALAAFIAGLIPYGLNLISHYSNSQKKRYAAERDFQHLKRNQEQIVANIAHIADEIDDYFQTLNRDILEIKLRLDIDAEKKRQKFDDDYK